MQCGTCITVILIILTLVTKYSKYTPFLAANYAKITITEVVSFPSMLGGAYLTVRTSHKQ